MADNGAKRTWSIEGVDPEAASVARAAADAAGVSVGDWLSEVVLRNTAGPDRRHGGSEATGSGSEDERAPGNGPGGGMSPPGDVEGEDPTIDAAEGQTGDGDQQALVSGSALPLDLPEEAGPIPSREGPDRDADTREALASIEEDRGPELPFAEPESGAGSQGKDGMNRPDGPGITRPDAGIVPEGNPDELPPVRETVASLPGNGAALEDEEENDYRLEPEEIARLRAIVSSEDGITAPARPHRARGTLLALLIVVAAAAGAASAFPDTLAMLRTRLPIMLGAGTGTQQAGVKMPTRNEAAAGRIERLPLDDGSGAAGGDKGNAVPRMPPGPPPVPPDSHPEWYRQAAEAGDARAESVLAGLYAAGKGVERDYEAAARWYERAAQAGVADAQFGLGRLYAEGRGVSRDPAEAFGWYERAAKQNYREAQLELGRAYANGVGTPRDHDAARIWFQRAAGQGSPEAQYELGVIYRDGVGTSPDKAVAYKWLSLAGASGYAPAVAALEKLTPKMTSAQMAEAKDLLLGLAAGGSGGQAENAGADTGNTTPPPPAPRTASSEKPETPAAPQTASVPATEKDSVSARTVAEIQTLLKRLNLDVGNTDGRMDDMTRQAIENYQRTAGLPVDGRPSTRLLDHLRAVFRAIRSGSG